MGRKNYGLYAGMSLKEYHQSYRLRNPEQCLLSSARSRAKRRNIPFNLTIEDIVIPEVCPVLGIPLTRNLGNHGGTNSSATIDRIVPEKGYVKGNIQVLSMLANNMKASATGDELVKFAKWVLENYT
jgi:hypothetical protein